MIVDVFFGLNSYSHSSSIQNASKGIPNAIPLCGLAYALNPKIDVQVTNSILRWIRLELRLGTGFFSHEFRWTTWTHGPTRGADFAPRSKLPPVETAAGIQ